MKPIRTPVAAFPTWDSEVVVVTDDGAVFRSMGSTSGWRQMPPIPGTIEAQIQAERDAEPAGAFDARD